MDGLVGLWWTVDLWGFYEYVGWLLDGAFDLWDFYGWVGWFMDEFVGL